MSIDRELDTNESYASTTRENYVEWLRREVLGDDPPGVEACCLPAINDCAVPESPILQENAAALPVAACPLGTRTVENPSPVTYARMLFYYENSIPLDLWLFSGDQRIDRAADEIMPLLATICRPRLVRSNLRQLLTCFIHLQKYHAGMYIGYPRKEGAWTRSAYIPSDVSFKMIEVIDALANLRLIEGAKGWRTLSVDGEMKGARSRMHPTEAFIDKYFTPHGLLEAEITIHPDAPLIVLRDSNGYDVAFEDTDETLHMKTVLQQYRDFMAGVSISSTNASDVPRIQGGRKFLHRVFNDGVFDKGGGFYGHCVQSLKRGGRKDILIDGEPTVELDYRGNHICFLYATHEINYNLEVGGDPYHLEGTQWGRPLIKKTMLTLLNSGNILSSYRAMRKVFKHDAEIMENLSTLEKFRELIDNIISKHPIFREYCSDDPNVVGIGIDLQYRGSCVCEQVLIDCMEQAVPVIPIQDSFIVKVQDEQKLRDSMAVAYSKLGIERALPEIRVKTRGGIIVE